jgi:hypothetical protein
MSRIGTHNSARIIAVVGASGMGKGATVKSEILPAFRGRVVVWSPLEKTDKYGDLLGVDPVHTIGGMIDAWQAKQNAVFVPGSDSGTMAKQFDLFCRAVWEMPGVCAVVEELSRVTTASWAPPAWRNLSTACRHQAVTLIGTCQRPAQVDKDFFGNCTEIRCFRVNYENDARVMSNVLRVTPGEVLELEKLHYIRRNLDARRNDLCVVGGGVVKKNSEAATPRKTAKTRK